MTECTHEFQYAGVVYSFENYPIPGSGAFQCIYEDKYFCKFCLQNRYINRRYKGTSYDKPLENTFPK